MSKYVQFDKFLHGWTVVRDGRAACRIFGRYASGVQRSRLVAEGEDGLGVYGPSFAIQDELRTYKALTIKRCPV